MIKHDEESITEVFKNLEGTNKNRNPRSKDLKNLNGEIEEKIRPKSLDIKIKKKKKNNLYSTTIENDGIYKQKVSIILEKTKKEFAQYEMNGNRNIWIMKPSGLSRGRGIKCCDDLDEILNQVKSGGNQLIIQKYIENPVIINKRKVRKIFFFI